MAIKQSEGERSVMKRIKNQRSRSKLTGIQGRAAFDPLGICQIFAQVGLLGLLLAGIKRRRGGKQELGEEHIGYQIKMLNHMISRKVMCISLKNGMDQVTLMHGWIIAWLYENQDKDIFQKDLETQFHITRSTVTNILKLMEKKGYIKRVSVDYDARLKKLVLTEMALKIQKQNFRDVQTMVEQQLVKDIPDEEVRIFLQVLHKMKENLEPEGGCGTEVCQKTGKEQDRQND